MVTRIRAVLGAPQSGKKITWAGLARLDRYSLPSGL